MKRIILFFAVCLGLSVSQTTFADTANTVRATSKRTATPTVTTQQTSNRATTSVAKRTNSTQNSSKNTRTSAQTQQQTTSRTTTKQTVKPRESTTVKNATTQTAKRVSTASRTASSRTVNSRQTESTASSARTGNTRVATSAPRIKRISRATELNTEKITNIKSLNYSKCKTVFYNCMDEFCANKDANLRRCACSSRIHEFDNIKKQLSDAEGKMLDFNQRLLAVGLDKEDAAAINVATGGEKAFATTDTSASEKILRTITDTLNSSGKSKIDNNLAPISLSLNMDTAWDNIDLTSGIATSAKSGTDLYNAATPICVEMAREVCTDDELNIAQDGYKLTIQQDCDTVAKSYKTQYGNAMEKIYESGALLDMSRLNAYQQNNSDDTLTCKKKILSQLSSTSVCGENLYKCLDMSGKYIDPSTGKAFLSVNLAELSSLLKEPSSGERWSKIQQNESFVKYLDSKKKFLEPATKQCKDIANMVWQEFLDDALAQIKLSQNAKLEEIRMNCTTLVAECKTEALQSLADFDARALSAFNIAADKTANAMCADIQNSCNALMNTEILSENLWQSGMTGIAADETYKKILETCTTIGRDCIINQCNGTYGNFALCQKATDDNRRAILDRRVCWDKVLKCVENADNLANMTISDNAKGNEYWTNENISYKTKNGNETNVCTENSVATCIAKQIWGNCEHKADEYNITNNMSIVTANNNEYALSNKIQENGSLLSWFAINTGTKDNDDSCNSKGCPKNYAMVNGTCQQLYSANNGTQTSDCGTPATPANVITVANDWTNYCKSGVLDQYGNCCESGKKNSGICIPDTGDTWQAARLWNLKCTSGGNYLCPTTGNLSLYCVTTSTYETPIAYYAAENEYACGLMDNGSFDENAMWIIVDEDGNYYNANENDTGTVSMYYYSDCSDTRCTYTYDNNSWTWSGTECNKINDRPTSANELLIKYN